VLVLAVLGPFLADLGVVATGCPGLSSHNSRIGARWEVSLTPRHPRAYDFARHTSAMTMDGRSTRRRRRRIDGPDGVPRSRAVEVRRPGGAELTLGGAIQQRILAALVLDANRSVSLTRLAEAALGPDRPATWRRLVQNRVSALRTVLTTAGGSHRDPYDFSGVPAGR
jgi:hypothetical protein